MADFSPPKQSDNGEYTVVPADMYNAVVLGVKEVPNKYYDESDPKSFPAQKTQLEWEIAIADGEYQGKKYKYWTQAYISRKGNKFTKLISVLDPNFSVDVGYSGMDEVQKVVTFKPVRIITKVKPGVRKLDDGTTEPTEFSNIDSFLKANAQVDEMWLADMVAKANGMTPTEPPF